MRALITLARKGDPLSVGSRLDAATFAGPVGVGVSAFDPDVLKAIWRHHPVLIIASVVGLSYTAKKLLRGE